MGLRTEDEHSATKVRIESAICSSYLGLHAGADLLGTIASARISYGSNWLVSVVAKMIGDRAQPVAA